MSSLQRCTAAYPCNSPTPCRQRQYDFHSCGTQETRPMSAALDILGSSWVPVLLLLMLTLYCRTQVGSWFVPSSFFGLFWFFFLVASLLAVDHRVPGLGMWVLVSLIAAVQLGSMLGETRKKEKQVSLTEGVQLQHMMRLRVLQGC